MFVRHWRIYKTHPPHQPKSQVTAKFDRIQGESSKTDLPRHWISCSELRCPGAIIAVSSWLISSLEIVPGVWSPTRQQPSSNFRFGGHPPATQKNVLQRARKPVIECIGFGVKQVHIPFRLARAVEVSGKYTDFFDISVGKLNMRPSLE